MIYLLDHVQLYIDELYLPATVHHGQPVEVSAGITVQNGPSAPVLYASSYITKLYWSHDKLPDPQDLLLRQLTPTGWQPLHL